MSLIEAQERADWPEGVRQSMAAIRSGLLEVLAHGEWHRVHALLDPTAITLQVSRIFVYLDPPKRQGDVKYARSTAAAPYYDAFYIA